MISLLGFVNGYACLIHKTTILIWLLLQCWFNFGIG